MKYNRLHLGWICISIISLISCNNNSDIEYSVADVPWEESYGNHRAIIEVDKAGTAIELDLLWRRHDKEPEEKRLLIISADNGDTIPNISRREITSESCNIVFGPVEKPGKYYFYYMPYAVQEGYGFYYKGHFIPEDEPEAEWLESININDEGSALPLAKCNIIESRTEFDSFFPMEIIATEEEKSKFLAENNRPFHIFPENRAFPIRMKHNIPQKWILAPPAGKFTGEALRNEYYVYQVGVWASGNNLENLEIKFTDLENGNSKIPSGKITCFNTEGIDPDGNYFTKNVNIESGNVQALWLGIDIDKDIKPGNYKGSVEISGNSIEGQKLDISLKIKNDILADRGDSELWRHSRLRWLNSTAGIDKNPVKPFDEVEKIDENKFKIGDKNMVLSENGLPKEIDVFGTKILASAIKLDIKTYKSNITSELYNRTSETLYPGEFQAEYECDNKELLVKAYSSVEFDGYISYKYVIRAKENIDIQEVRLDIPFNPDIAEYMMGMGLPGSRVPNTHKAKWEGPHDSFWLGNTYGGIHCEIRGSDYNGPLLNLYKPEPPVSWHNDGKGGFGIEQINGIITAYINSGERKLMEGEEISFEFSFIITPIHELKPASQFTDRYYHNGGDPAPDDDELEDGVKIINLHHANEYNPHINYPFIATDEMRGFIDKYHSKDQKVKIYYTIRELTNWVTEIWALRSLGDEIIGDGRGGGFPWLSEHFIDGYTPQWYQRLDSTKVDASLLTSTGESRWFNYYIEGLGWLVENMDIDGLYLDDVSFDRRMLKRMRKVMEERKPGCIIDLHSNTGFSKGPATQYTDFFPYIDKLWFGESFQYNNMPPENWLVEVSGIPFGLMGDMLHGGGNPWRGMIYGMTVRYPWTTEGVTCNPRDLWKVWDDFDIASSEMVGYWNKNSIVSTDNEDILLTYYQHQDKILISIASWSEKEENIRINADWKSLGFDPAKSLLIAPEIKNFQPETKFKLEDSIPVEPGKGWLLLVCK